MRTPEIECRRESGSCACPGGIVRGSVVANHTRGMGVRVNEWVWCLDNLLWHWLGRTPLRTMAAYPQSARDLCQRPALTRRQDTAQLCYWSNHCPPPAMSAIRNAASRRSRSSQSPYARPAPKKSVRLCASSLIRLIKIVFIVLEHLKFLNLFKPIAPAILNHTV